MKQQYYNAAKAESFTARVRRIMETNLCKEIILPTPWLSNSTPLMFESKYKFSRAKWYHAEFDSRYYDEVREWCTQQFGPQPRVADAWTRWYHNYHDVIFFRDEPDYNWFVLRWGA